jgi:signal transduction histidine kinase/DNA-binding response OmpR family regulator
MKPTSGFGLLLAPAKKIMNKLSYARKFALIALLALMPLVFVIVQVFQQTGHAIEVARSELAGVKYLQALRLVQKQLAQVRSKALFVEWKKPAARPDLVNELERLQEALDALLVVDKDLSLELSTRRKLQVLLENHAYLKKTLMGDSPVAVNESLRKLHADLFELMEHVGNTSRLILDPEISSYYLMDVALLRLPAAADMLTHIGAVALSALEKGELDTAGRVELTRLSVLLQSSVGKTSGALDFAFQAHRGRDLKQVLGEPYNSYERASTSLLLEVQEGLLNPERGLTSGAQLTSLVDHALVRNFALGDRASHELQRLLMNRVDNHKRQQMWILGCTALALALVAYLWLAFYAGVMETVAQLKLATHKMQDDASPQDVVVVADDEFGTIVKAFNQMAGRLRAEKGQAEDESTKARQAEAELRAREEELTRSREEALGAARAKAAFLATMSHEIRTPLNGVVGMSTLMAETRLDSEQADYLRTIRTSSDQLLAVINDILDFSKIESGKLELEQEPLNLLNVIEEACDIGASRAREKGLELVIDVLVGDEAGALPKSVVGDSTRLRQVLINLVSNAVKFTTSGEVCVQARRLESAKGTDWAAIEFKVRDTGIGIAPDAIDSLFEAFSQADASTTRRYGGTGLGLAISRRIVSLMGGTISAQSVQGQGSTFTFTIDVPVSFIAELAVADADRLTGKRALVVDDHLTNVLVLTRQLRHWGMEVDSAESASQALALLEAAQSGRAQKPEIIITDMHMPGMDGLSFTRAVKEQPSWRNTPVVLLSSGFLPAGDEHANLFAARLLKPARHTRMFETLLRSLGAPPEPAGATSQASPESKRELRILVVDDNEVNLKVACAMLTRLGYPMHTVTGGREAVAAVSQAITHGAPYAAVLMDVNMPDIDGLQATQQILSAYKDQAPPIIALTASASMEDRDRCLASGMVDHISKPLQVRALSDSLGKWARAGASAGGQSTMGDGAVAFERLEELTGFSGPNGNLALEVLDTFMVNAPHRLQAIETAIAQGDARALRRAAHAFRGVAANVGANVVAAIAGAIESETDTAIPPLAEQRLLILKAQLGVTLEMLEKWKRNFMA